MRYFIEIAYDGTPYHGWQRQPNAVTVQELLEKALGTLLRRNIHVTGAGRTDAGVHARQLFAHFDLDKPFDVSACGQLTFRLNRLLPQSIAVKSVFPVNEEAHARFDASSRCYEYWLTPKKDPFLVNRAFLVERRVDFEAMNQAAELLLGRQDFKCFSRSKTDVKTYLCEITYAQWKQVDGVYVFRVSADRFLRNMVRAVVGTLMEMGQGKKSVSEMQGIISARDRSKAGASVPAHGLYLAGITYPNTIYSTDGREQ